MTGRVHVIGAGMGGLAAAVRLAAAGCVVEVFESAQHPGGKAGFVEIEGVRIDTGPSVLTLPEVFDALFEVAGENRADHLEWIQPEPSFAYRWRTGESLSVYSDMGRTLESVRASFGPTAANDFEGFMRYAERIWEASSQDFVFGPQVSWARIMGLPPKKWLSMTRIDAFSKMSTAIRKRVRSPFLRDVLMRYATSNGSDPRTSPATFNCIAHVELALGGYGVRGGMYALTEAVYGLAKRLGVTFHFETPVLQIASLKGRVQGLETSRGFFPASYVVANTEATHLLRALLGRPTRRPKRLSSSLWTGIYRGCSVPQPTESAPHVVYFPSDYSAEFQDLAKGRMPSTPSIYLCDADRAHQVGAFETGRPLFATVNSPPLGQAALPILRSEWNRTRDMVTSFLVSEDVVTSGDALLWERTPETLHERFPDSYGALYGEASTNWRSAFTRPGTHLGGIEGLVFASGSGHPGGGLPFVALSGKLAAESLLKEMPRTEAVQSETDRETTYENPLNPMKEGQVS